MSGFLLNPYLQSPPDVPQDLVAVVALAAGSIDLSWSAAARAASYSVERAPTSGGVFVEIASGVTGTSHTDTGLSNDTSYYYRVRATNAAGDSAYSNEATAKTWLGFDSFDRADSTSLGSLETGQGWIAYLGSRQIQSNAFCSTATARGSSVADFGVSDVTIVVKNETLLNGGLGRFIDCQGRCAASANDHNLVQFGNSASSQILAFKRVAGTYTQVGSTVTEDIPAGAECSLSFAGNLWTVAVDGVTKISASDAANNARTRHGPGAGAVTSKVSWFGVRT